VRPQLAGRGWAQNIDGGQVCVQQTPGIICISANKPILNASCQRVCCERHWQTHPPHKFAPAPRPPLRRGWREAAAKRRAKHEAARRALMHWGRAYLARSFNSWGEIREVCWHPWRQGQGCPGRQLRLPCEGGSARAAAAPCVAKVCLAMQKLAFTAARSATNRPHARSKALPTVLCRSCRRAARGAARRGGMTMRNTATTTGGVAWSP
jgi:hypothetical protein